MTWIFPKLKTPSVFIAAPGDMNYLRRSTIRMFHRLKQRVADDHGIEVYDFKTETSEIGFKDWKPAQGQIPLPSDKKCEALICILGERLGTSLSDDFPLEPLGDNCPALLATSGPRLVHPWRDDAAADQGFALTGTVFEYLTAIAANEQTSEDGKPLVLFLCVGDGNAPQAKRVIDGNWGNKRLLNTAEKKIVRRSELRDWEDEEYKPQLEQLRNFIRYVQKQKGSVRFVSSEEEALAVIQRFLTRELDLRLIEEERNPFKGLDNYDTEDWSVFFGREELRRSVIDRLIRLFEHDNAANLLRISGGSGCGKSSLLRAGVIGHLCHHLSDGDFCGSILRPNDLLPGQAGGQGGDDMVMHDSREPAVVPRLFARVLHNIDSTVEVEAAEKELSITKPEYQADEAVRQLVAALAKKTRDGERWRLLIGLDQFEEIVDALCDDRRQHIWLPLMNFIARAARHPDIAILYTLQTNRVPLIDDNYVLHPLMAGTTQEVDFPTSGLDEIIIKPFPLKRVNLEPELADELIERIRAFAVTTERGSLLPLVSVTLARLFKAYEERRSAHAPLSEFDPRAAAFPALSKISKRAGKAAQGSSEYARQTEGTGQSLRVEGATGTTDAAPTEEAGAVSSDTILRLEEYRQFLSVEDAIGEAADRALEEAKAAASLSWGEDTVASLLQLLVRRGDRLGSERLAFPSVTLTQGTAIRRLAESLATQRLVAREGPDRFRLVHEAVIRKWEAGRDWLRDEQSLLERFEEIYNAAKRWRQEGTGHAFLQGMGDQQVKDGGELLARWYNVLKPRPGDSESAESQVRDFALALLAEHATPTREIPGPKRTTRHIHIASIYERIDIVREYLKKDASAAKATRSDGRTALFDASFVGASEILQLLLDHDAPPEQADDEGWLPIHAAATAGMLECFELLARRMDKLDAPGKEGMTPLHMAVVNGHSVLVEHLLADERNDRNVRDERLWTPLHYAAYYGHDDITRLFIAHGAELDALDKQGWSPLHLAVQTGNDSIAQLLIEHDARIKARLSYGWTPLHLSALHGRCKTAALLIERGAHVEAYLYNGCTPLHLAALKGHDTIARLLVENRAQVNALCNNDWRNEEQQKDKDWVNRDWTPLHFAIEKGHDAIAQVLLENGADANAPNDGGRTPLHFAAENGNENVVQLLLKYDAQARARDVKEWTPLHLAADKGHQAVAQLLLDYSGEVEPRDNELPTPLHLALAQNHYALAQLLITRGAIVDTPLADGRTLLHSAAKKGDANRTGFLLANQADANARNGDGWTPLHFAAENGNENVVQLLLKYDAQVRARDVEEWTPLHLAADKGHQAVAQLLLEHGAQIEAIEEEGTTPLHLAAGKGHETLVELLLDRGAEPNAVDSKGWTPLHIAAQNGHEQVVMLLLTRGADAEAISQSPPLTPLQAAAEVGQIGVVTILLEQGANIHAENDRKGSPLFLAVRNARYTMALQLLEAGAALTSTDIERTPALGALIKENQARRKDAGVDITATELELIRRLLSVGVQLPKDVVAPGGETKSDEPCERHSTQNGLAESDEQARIAGDVWPYAQKPRHKVFAPLQNDTDVGRDSGIAYPWKHVDTDSRLWLAEQLNPIDGQLEILESTQIIVSELPWYHNFRLLRIKDQSWPDKKLAIFYLMGDDKTLVRLDGTSSPIHEVNAESPILLREDNVVEYIRFFGFFVRAKDGMFYVLEALDDPALPPDLDMTSRFIIEWTARPALYERRNEQEHFLCNAVISFSTSLYIVRFAVHPTGIVDMVEDDPIAGNLAFSVEAPITLIGSKF